MKVSFVLVLAALVCVTATTLTVRDEERMFADFMQTYQRTYTGALKEHRFQCFVGNLKLIQQRNAKGAERHSVNQFADLCPDEFARMYLGYKASNHSLSALPKLGEINPNHVNAGCNVDWRTKGAVTSVQNQGQCGASYAFAIIANCEGVWQIAGHPLVSLSVGELVACDSNNQGCNGGEIDVGYGWIVKNGGLDSAADYPFGINNGNCVQSKVKNIVAAFSESVKIDANEAAMAAYVCEHGPISVGVDASTWPTYEGGVMSQCGNEQIDHAVAVVGVDTEANPPYWILKNSWGTSWGEEGYLRLEYGKNLCGIDSTPMSILAKK